MRRRITSLISLCQRAGRVVSGEETCEKSLRNGSAKLVIIATDASANTRKKFINKSFYYETKVLEFCTKDELSKSIGKINRATIIIIDEVFAEKLINLIEAYQANELENLENN